MEMNVDTEEVMQQELENAKAQERKAIKDVLKKTKVFKDFIVGKEKEWEAIKDAIAIHAYKLPIAGDDTISKDFIAGIRYFSELVDGYANQFDRAYDALGKE